MTRTTTPEPRFVLGASSGDDAGFLVPDDASATPDDVKVLNDKAIHASQALAQAAHAYTAAKDAVRQAGALDAAADTSAAAAGTPLPQRRAADEAVKAAAQATRRLEAARQHHRDCLINLARGINHHRVVWLEEQSGVISVIKSDLNETLNALATQLAALDRERKIERGLVTSHPQAASSARASAGPERSRRGSTTRAAPT